MRFPSVVLGGTFDRLHKGHCALLSKAFAVGDRVTIGLTTDEYVDKFKIQKSKVKSTEQNSNVFSYSTRKQQLEEWLGKQGWNGRYTIVPLSDSYGPTVVSATQRCNDVTISGFDAIVVSSETRKTAEKINTIRKEKGLKALHIVEIPMVPAEDLQTISSTRVRKGEIDPSGRLILPDALRGELRKAIGDHITDRKINDVLKGDDNRILVTVGDMTTKKIFNLGIRPTLAIIDFQMERKPFLWEKETLARLTEKSTIISLQSGPGYISQEALRAIRIWAHPFKGVTLQGLPAIVPLRGTKEGVYSNYKHTVIFVDGEEDLLVLPVILEAPLRSVVYYGQPAVVRSGLVRRGIIRVLITKEKKDKAKFLLNKFVPYGR